MRPRFKYSEVWVFYSEASLQKMFFWSDKKKLKRQKKHFEARPLLLCQGPQGVDFKKVVIFFCFCTEPPKIVLTPNFFVQSRKSNQSFSKKILDVKICLKRCIFGAWKGLLREGGFGAFLGIFGSLAPFRPVKPPICLQFKFSQFFTKWEILSKGCTLCLYIVVY